MKILVVIALILLGMYGCYHVAVPSATIHYKLTLIVDDNGKQISGSSVVQVYREDTTKVFSGIGGYGGEFKGEAVVVDLGQKGVLFALLKGDPTRTENYGSSEPLFIALRAFAKSGNVIDNMRQLNKDKPETNLDFDLVPMLVRFRDINDPKTVELVDPNDLEKTFGKGVKLTSATIKITDEKITTIVNKYMPPFDEKTGYLEWFRSLPYGDSRKIGPYDFIAGVK